ncbi:rhamnogalacturonan acetylesterase [Flavobacterium sp. W21_SRS_FM6]|uniref:rhamnogalacturonan acetylesterase n=1 Tax=Flavobacterium sp. W21_SRS_FM6 TaxID=3240268 RepID=UPI003F901308
MPRFFAPFIVAVSLLCLINLAWAEQPKPAWQPHTIFVAGDSTAATYNDPQHQGWAAVLDKYLDSSVVKVDNRARGGRSTRTFISEGLWQKLIDDVQPGDVVLIQFGHNDASAVNDDSRARGTLPGLGDESVDIHNLLSKQDERVYTFGHYIRQMVAEVKAKHATPILLSLTARNIWQQGRIERGSGQYGGWMYQLSWELDTAFIDVSNPVADALEAMGMEQTAALYTKDHTHFNALGAELHASTIIAALKGLKPTLDDQWYSELGRNVAAAQYTWLRQPFVTNAHLPSIFMVGDSTVRNGAGDGANGEWGWGDFIKEHISDKQFNLVNRAIGGLSSRTFVTGGHWQRALNMMKPGDYVLIQFGHNDNAPLNDDKRARGTIKGLGFEFEVINNLVTGDVETVHSYGWYLRKMIGEARALGITPIICSPVPRKIFQDDAPRIDRAVNSYPQWAQQVARQSGTLFIDLHSLIAQQYDVLGQANVAPLFADKHTHTSEAGAKLTAATVAKELHFILGR